MSIIYIIYTLSYIHYTSSCLPCDDFVEYDNDISDQKSLEGQKKNEVFDSGSLELSIAVKNAIADEHEGNHSKNINREDYGSGQHEDMCWSTLTDYPYAVSIQKKGAHHATGALLNKHWILTSAGEFYLARELLKLFRARLGSVDCKQGGTLVPLKEIHVHPSYVPLKPSFDLALLRTGVPVEYTDCIQPIELSSVTENEMVARFTTVYWPRLIVHGEPLPSSAKERIQHNNMRVSKLKLIPWKKCSRKIKNKGKEIGCIQPVIAHHTVCMPDSGAPVVAEKKLWGITSSWTSKNCTSDPSPTIFTRLSSRRVRSWLDSVLREEASDLI